MLKILGMGLHKTGTRTISKALEILGYNSNHGGRDVNIALVNKKIDFKKLNKYDAIFDGFCCLKYRTLDSHYDDLKFIYTTRNLESWLASCQHRYRGHIETITRKAVFGEFAFDKKIWTDSYLRHEKQVRDYFKGRNDILEINIEEKNKWEKLCEFLNCDIPEVEFPWIGKRRA